MVVGTITDLDIAFGCSGDCCYRNNSRSVTKMTYTIIATGSSAQNFIPRGHVIGCNDAARLGKLDSLVVCNRPQQFSKERYEIIKNTKVENFYSHKSAWAKEFPSWQKINLTPWYGTYHKGQIYSSNSSPIIAITLVVKLGAKDIIMWGADFKNHAIFHEGNPQTKREVEVYIDLYHALKQCGVSLYIGATGTAFDCIIPEWSKAYDFKPCTAK